jgi:hypothetical protein
VTPRGRGGLDAALLELTLSSLVILGN